MAEDGSLTHSHCNPKMDKMRPTVKVRSRTVLNLSLRLTMAAPDSITSLHSFQSRSASLAGHTGTMAQRDLAGFPQYCGIPRA